MQKDTPFWRSIERLVREWDVEQCEHGDTFREHAHALYMNFWEWSKAKGYGSYSMVSWGAVAGTLYLKQRESSGVRYYGVRLKPTTTPHLEI